MKETGHDHWFEHSQLWDKLVLTCYFAWGSPSLLFTPLLKLSYPTERTSVLSQQVPHQRCRALILASGTSRISIKIKKKKIVLGPEQACGASAKSNCSSDCNRFTLHLH